MECPGSPIAITNQLRIPTPVIRGGRAMGTSPDIGNREPSMNACADGDDGGVGVAPYQALPITKSRKITENIATGLEVIENANLSEEEVMEQVGKIIEAYRQRLEHRTKHHLGYPYNLEFDMGILQVS